MKQLPPVDISKIDPTALKLWQQICGAKLLQLIANLYIKRHPPSDDTNRALADALLSALNALDHVMSKSQEGVSPNG
jgi:hypothetical protein